MKAQWFTRLGWFYAPVSAPGAIITLVLLAFCVQVFIAVDHKSHSISDTFYGIFPFFSGAFFLYDWLGARTSRSNRKPI